MRYCIGMLVLDEVLEIDVEILWRSSPSGKALWVSRIESPPNEAFPE